MTFEDWLKKNNLQKSIKHYAPPIKGTLSKLSIDNKISTVPLNEISDPELFKEILLKIKGAGLDKVTV